MRKTFHNVFKKLIFNAENLQWPIHIWIYFKTDIRESFLLRTRSFKTYSINVWGNRAGLQSNDSSFSDLPFWVHFQSQQCVPTVNSLQWSCVKTHGYSLLSMPLPILPTCANCMAHHFLGSIMNINIIQETQSVYGLFQPHSEEVPLHISATSLHEASSLHI